MRVFPQLIDAVQYATTELASAQAGHDDAWRCQMSHTMQLICNFVCTNFPIFAALRDKSLHSYWSLTSSANRPRYQRACVRRLQINVVFLAAHADRRMLLENSVLALAVSALSPRLVH